MTRRDPRNRPAESEALAATVLRPDRRRLPLALRTIGLGLRPGPLRRAVLQQRLALFVYGGALVTAAVWAIFVDEPAGHWLRVLSRLFMVSLVALGGLGWALESRRLDQSIQTLRHGALEQLALSDDLTGLANRRAFFQRLQQEWGRFERYRRPFALIILDLDEFKQVNDRFGHQMGDRSLQWLAAHLRRCLRQGDMAARLGGDEFALLLPETSAESAGEMLNRLRLEVGSDRTLVDRRTGLVVDLQISGGVAAPDARTPDADHVVFAADTQLYARKGERSSAGL